MAPRIALPSAAVFALLFMPSACGSSSEDGGAGGSSASGGSRSGTGGGAGAGGSSGTGTGGDGGASAASGTGGGGSGGGSGNAGAGGNAGANGSGGSAGTGGVSEPECLMDKDCVLIDDCCSCEAVPATDKPPACPDIACLISTCPSKQNGASVALCVLGRCVLNVSCDDSTVSCERSTPECPTGELPAVDGTCWVGGCAPASECSGVTACADCGAELACVVADSLSDTVHCVTPASGCQSDRSCSCLGSSVCIAPFPQCSDSEPDGAVHCRN
jgi:hypothetical protein